MESAAAGYSNELHILDYMPEYQDVTPIIAVGRHKLLMLYTIYVAIGSNIDRCPYMNVLTVGHIIGLAREGIIRDTCLMSNK